MCIAPFSFIGSVGSIGLTIGRFYKFSFYSLTTHTLSLLFAFLQFFRNEFSHAAHTSFIGVDTI